MVLLSCWSTDFTVNHSLCLIGVRQYHHHRHVLGVASLQYLSSQQALGDVANFLTWYKNTTPGAKDSKVCSSAIRKSHDNRSSHSEVLMLAHCPHGPVLNTQMSFMDQYHHQAQSRLS